jgi:hypothetical protein
MPPKVPPPVPAYVVNGQAFCGAKMGVLLSGDAGAARMACMHQLPEDYLRVDHAVRCTKIGYGRLNRGYVNRYGVQGPQ